MPHQLSERSVTDAAPVPDAAVPVICATFAVPLAAQPSSPLSKSACRSVSAAAAGKSVSDGVEADGSKAFVEIGGGIRDDSTVAEYLDAGIDRVILGTAAVKDPDFLARCVEKYGYKIAVGIDVRDGFVAVKGWTELSQYRLEEFTRMMQDSGVRTIICTDISRDGAMRGTNRELYRQLSESLDIDIVASGGVSSIEDVEALTELGIHGAIIGKAYYTGAIDLAEAVKKGATK